MLRKQDKLAARFGLPPETRHALILVFWAVLICCVVIGSLLPAASSVMVAVGRMHISDKVQHFCAYLALSFLPVLAVQDLRRGTAIGLSMIVLGGLLELGQTFSPGRSPDIRDQIANTLGVVCAVLLARGCRYGSGAWRKREAA